MTSQKLIDDITEWVKESIASKHEFKVPPPSDEEETGNYDYTLAHPGVFPMYFPSVEEGEFIAPAILVQAYDGKLNLATGSGTITVRLVFQVWNPGTHDGKTLVRNSDGWRDLDSIIETTLTEIAKKRIINGHHVHEDSLEYSHLKQDDAIMDLYPFFCGHVVFTMDNHKFIQPEFFETL